MSSFDFVAGSLFFFFKMADLWTKIPHRLGLTVVSFAFQLFVHSFFWCQNQEYTCFFGAPLLAGPLSLSRDNGDSPHEISNFFFWKSNLMLKRMVVLRHFPCNEVHCQGLV